MEKRKERSFADQVAAAERVAESVRDQLLERPGVVLVGVGAERKRGRPTGRAAIVVSVQKKLSVGELRSRGWEPLPREIDGVPIDVNVYGQSPETGAVRRAFSRVIDVKDKIAADWLAAPNVTAVGVGYKIVAGELTDQVAIHIYVAEKLSAEAVAERGYRHVPEVLGGVPTDVIEAGPFTVTVSPSGSRGDRRDPLIGGLSIGHGTAPFKYGTLGAIAFDASNAAVVLSNEHVLNGAIGETVHQPSPVGLDDSFTFDLQLDVCNPLHFFRLDTPDTVGGSILAGAAVAAAIAAALSDEIDPTREGQEATPTPPGTQTLEEYTKTKIDYPTFPLPGRPFEVGLAFSYERRTTAGALRHDAQHKRTNPHVLTFHRLFTDRDRYTNGERVRLFGIVVPGADSRRACEDFHCVALLRPIGLDRSYPIVLRPWGENTPGRVHPQLHTLAAATHADATPIAAPSREQLIAFLLERGLTEDETLRIAGADYDPCLFYGEFSTDNAPLGPWRHWMHVQTQNTVPPGTKPLEAAQFIGGLPLSDHFRSTVDVACGPLVFEDDGSFDIELI